MAIIYAMNKENKHSYTEVLNGLLSNQPYFIEYVKSTNFTEDDLMGLKLFLEDNNYSIDTLKKFTSTTPLKVISKPNYKNYRVYKIAAFIVISLGVSYFIKISISKQKNIEYYMVEDAGFKIWMSSTSNQSIDILNGMNYYRNNNYQEALIYFSKKAKNDTSIFYSSLSYIKLKQLKKAELLLTQIPDNSVYKNKSIYYLSLCYLYTNQEKKAIKLLKSTIFEDPLIEEKRKKLLIDLKN